MLVCWDAENMDAQTEPDPTDTPDEESFPWLDDLQARGIWVTGDQLTPPRRARSVRVRNGKSQASSRLLAGTCRCGAVRYEVSDAFLYAANCHWDLTTHSYARACGNVAWRQDALQHRALSLEAK